MLSYALAIAVALSSLVLFSTAFLMSDIHRQDDFLWSGVGLFYALILWFCARNITGAVLLGQAAAAVLVVSYSWQTLKLRKAVANPAKAEEINNFSILQAVNGLLKRNKPQSLDVATKTTPGKVTESEIAIPDTASTETVPKSEPRTDNARSTKPKASDKSVVITNNKAESTSEQKIEPKETESGTQPATKESATDPSVVQPEIDIELVDEKTVAAQSSGFENTKAAVEENRVIEKVEEDSPKKEQNKPENQQPETANNIEPEAVKSDFPVTTEDSAPQITDNTVDAEQLKASEIIEQTPTTEKKKPSKLDSLETVEVAEGQTFHFWHI